MLVVCTPSVISFIDVICCTAWVACICLCMCSVPECMWHQWDLTQDIMFQMEGKQLLKVQAPALIASIKHEEIRARSE
jgi:hypothetical protein